MKVIVLTDFLCQTGLHYLKGYYVNISRFRVKNGQRSDPKIGIWTVFFVKFRPRALKLQLRDNFLLQLLVRIWGNFIGDDSVFTKMNTAIYCNGVKRQ